MIPIERPPVLREATVGRNPRADPRPWSLQADFHGGGNVWWAHGERVTEPKEIGPALQRAFASGRPAVLDVPIDRATNKGSGKPM